MPDYAIKFRYPLNDIKKEFDLVGKEVMEAMEGVIKNADFILGNEVTRFEEEFARYCGVKHCIGVGSGTAALYISLLNYGIGEGDDVIIPAFTFKASAWAVVMAGAKPVLAEVEPDTGNIDPKTLEQYLTPNTRAIMPVHIFGHPADMDSILTIAKKNNLLVIEDACEAHGAAYKGRISGSMGDCGAFSFYPSKNLGCYGDGGAITTNDDALEKETRAIRNYGNNGKTGINSRLSTLQGAVLRVKFRYLDGWIARRREIASLYNECLKDLPINTPVRREYADPVYYLYVIHCKERDQLKDFLWSKGVEARVHFNPPVHLLSNFPSFTYKKGDFPISERLSNEVLSLPMHPFLSNEGIREICGFIREFYCKEG